MLKLCQQLTSPYISNISLSLMLCIMQQDLTDTWCWERASDPIYQGNIGVNVHGRLAAAASAFLGTFFHGIQS